MAALRQQVFVGLSETDDLGRMPPNASHEFAAPP